MKDIAVQKEKLERLTLIKERYHKLVLKQRQEIEKEMQDDFKEHDDFDSEAPEPTNIDIDDAE